MARCRATVVLASGVGVVWLLTCSVGWADGASAQGSAVWGAHARASAVVAQALPAAAGTEGWTSFSHWHRNANGSITNDVYAVPTFSAGGGSWHRVAEAVKRAVGTGAVSATADLARPVQFGNDQSHLETLALDAGPVTISAPQLTIGPPSATTASSVKYSAVAPNTDLWYVVNPHAVVEDLVLKSALAPTSFTFHIGDPSHALGDLHMQSDSAQFSSLVDGDVQLGLAAPFAYEESSASSPLRDSAVPIEPGSAHMTVTPAGDGWDVTESVDASWLKGKSFPIVLDPTITFDHPSGTMVAGSDIYSTRSCNGGGCSLNTTSQDLSAGTYTDATYDEEPSRSVFKFDLSSAGIPPSSPISNATFSAYTIACLGNPNGGTYYCNQHDYDVELHQLNGPWSTSSTYDQIAAITDASAFSSLYQPAFSANSNPPCTGCFWENFDVTTEAQRWLNSPSTNYGFVAKLQTEPYSIGGPFWSYLGTQGGGNGYPGPHLSVTYTSNAPTGGEMLGGDNPSEPGVFACFTTNYPVDCATGDLYHTFSDLSIPGRGMSLQLDRTYNSLAAATNGLFGYGWTSSYGMSLAVDGSGDVTVSQENGSEVTFNPASGGGYTAPARVTASLVRNPDGSYTFTRGQRDRFTFSSSGQLTGAADLNGYTTTFSYSGGRLATVTDPGGRSLSFTYGANGDVASVSDSGGRSVSYHYDSSGNLTSVFDVGGGTTSFTYDPNHLLLTMTDPRNGTTTNTYDSSSRVTAQVDPMNRRTTFSYSAASSTITDPNGNSEAENYTNGLLSSLTRGAGSPQAATWTFGYQSPTLAPTSITDPNGHTTHATYDAQANLLTKTDGLGHVTTYAYDSLNDLTSTTDPTGHTTTLTYNANGDLLSKSRPVTATSQTARTTYTYGDASHPGDVTSVTDPTGAQWTYVYDSYGDQIKSVDPLGNTTTSTFDILGRRTSTVTPKGNVPGADPARSTTSYTYNAFGDLLTTTDPLGGKTTNVYDAARNLISSTDPDGHTTTNAYDLDNELSSITRADGSVTGYGYNGDGDRISWTDSNGNVTQYGYDALDRQTSITDPLGRTTSSVFDGVGNLVSITDPSSQVTTYHYDAADEPVTVNYSDGKTPNVTYTYNADGQLASQTSQSLSRTYTYDSLNRLAGTSEQDAVQPVVGISVQFVNRGVTYGYDLASRVTSLTLSLSGITRNFSRTYDSGGELTAVSDGLGHTTSFGYDANSNFISETYQNGAHGTYRYDDADRMTQITDTNAVGTFLSLSYARDPNGLVTSDDASANPGGQALTDTYDAANRLASATPQPSGYGNTYGYDPADNRTSWTMPAGGALTFSFDRADELVSAVGSTATTSFGFDSRGDRTSESDTLGNRVSYGFDQAGRLVTYAGPTVNMIGKTAGAQVQQAYYGYDSSGLRTDVAWDLVDGTPLIIGDPLQNAYLTGPEGLPVERVDATGGVAYYHQDQLGSTRALTDSSGAVLVSYSYDPYGNAIASNGTVSNPFQYAGQYTDTSTGLMYMRARWYDPTTAVFLSVDPAVASTAQPYVYAQDNPVNKVDPTGLCSLSECSPELVCGFMGCRLVYHCQARATTWVCQAKCALINYRTGSAERFATGTGYGSSEDAACRNAKANVFVPLGYYKRHCRCYDCKKTR